MSPRLIPAGAALVAAATVLAVGVEADSVVRVPLVAVVMLVLPGLGIWRLTRLEGAAPPLAALVVLASLVCDVVVAQGLLLAGHLSALPFVVMLGAVGVLGALRDLPGRRA